MRPFYIQKKLQAAHGWNRNRTRMAYLSNERSGIRIAGPSVCWKSLVGISRRSWAMGSYLLFPHPEFSRTWLSCSRKPRPLLCCPPCRSTSSIRLFRRRRDRHRGGMRIRVWVLDKSRWKTNCETTACLYFCTWSPGRGSSWHRTFYRAFWLTFLWALWRCLGERDYRDLPCTTLSISLYSAVRFWW